jgi:hypothetical protein
MKQLERFERAASMNYPQPDGVSEDSNEKFCPKGVTPECLNRGSSSISPGFPIEAFGNDGLGFTQQTAVIKPAVIEAKAIR